MQTTLTYQPTKEDAFKMMEIVGKFLRERAQKKTFLQPKKGDKLTWNKPT